MASILRLLLCTIRDAKGPTSVSTLSTVCANTSTTIPCVFPAEETDGCALDALKGIGHACGHNLIAITSLGAALATAQILKEFNLAGKVVLLGTPAEEGGGGKIKLLNAGAFSDNDIDISLITHPGVSPDAALVRTAAYQAFDVSYTGKEAHAAARPWEGVS